MRPYEDRLDWCYVDGLAGPMTDCWAFLEAINSVLLLLTFGNMMRGAKEKGPTRLGDLEQDFLRLKGIND